MTELPQNLAFKGTGTTLAHVADRLLNTPLLLAPAKAELILHVLQGRLSTDTIQVGPLSEEANAFRGRPTREGDHMYAVENGTAIIPIIGSLVNRGSWIGANSGMVSYEGLSAQLERAASDPDVKRVFLDIDSGGGEAGGMLSLSKQIRALNAVKPVTAFVNDVAASAAYGIAAAAGEIVVSETSIVGSIGVVFLHLDRSGEIEQAGIKPTFIHAGAHKVDGHPFGALEESVRADIQARVDTTYGKFVADVAMGRKNLTEQEIRATEAKIYSGQEAITVGLADRIGTLKQSLDRNQQQARGAKKRGVLPMAKTTSSAPEGNTAELAEFSAADIAQIKQEARAEGATRALSRVKAILTCEEAKGRQALAMTLAFDQAEISPESAKAILGAAASEQANIPHRGTIAERAAQNADAGHQLEQTTNAAEATAALWGKAVKSANASLGK